MIARETKPGIYWTRNTDHLRRYYSVWNERYGKMLAFTLDLQHYRRERGYTDDRRLVQPKGQALFNLIRHKTAVVSGSPISFQCRPVQPVADGGRAELSQRLLERTVFDPLLRYKQARHRFVLSALAGGRGVMAIEHLPDEGPNGKVAVRVVDPRRFHIAAGHVDLHDRRTPHVIEEIPVSLEWLMAQRENGWDVPANPAVSDDTQNGHGVVQPDDWTLRDERGAMGDRPGETEFGNDKSVLLLKCFSHKDPWRKTKTVLRPEYSLPREDWYFTDDLGNRVKADVDLDDPGFVQPMSPATGLPMRLITREQEMAEELEYPDGRMWICVKGMERPVFDDRWTPKTRTYPYMFLNCYLHPLRLIGKSDSELNHSLQVVDNAALKNAYDQTRLAQAIMVMRKNGLKDTDGRPFQPSDEPMQIAVADNLVDSEAVKFFQAPGMNSTLPAFYQMIQNAWSLIGTGDIKMPDNRSRDVPVGTMQALQQVGELPSKVHVEMLQAEEAVGFGVMLDMLRDTMTAQEMLSWAADNGEVQFTEVSGKDLTPVNVMVDSQADWRGMDVDRVQAIAQFMGQVPPQMWGTLGKAAGLPPEAVREMTMFSQTMMHQPPPMDTPSSRGKKPAASAA